MAMQTDVKSTQPLTSTGAFKDQGGNNLGRVRIKGIYAVCGASAGLTLWVCTVPKALPKETGGGEAGNCFPSFLFGVIPTHLGI